MINILVYYGIISNVFNSDIDKEDDYKLLASRLQNFLICVEMFLAGVYEKVVVFEDVVM